MKTEIVRQKNNPSKEFRSLEELLLDYQQGNSDAFKEFFACTKKFIFHFIFSRLHNRQDAEDVFQETYFRLHHHIMRYDPQRKAIVWLISIARNALIDKVKSKKRNTNRSINIDSINTDDDNINREILENSQTKETADEKMQLNALLQELLQGLNQSEVEFITERVFNEESYESIAKKFNVTEDNARQKISRILKKIRKLLPQPFQKVQ